jgi:hypothetical protein
MDRWTEFGGVVGLYYSSLRKGNPPPLGPASWFGCF